MKHNYLKSLFLMLMMCVGMGAWGETLSIDFENELKSYESSWVFTNVGELQTSITAHGGSYYGSTSGKTTCSIATKSKIAKPQTLTFYISKASTNTTSSNWKIQVSTNNSKWEDVKTQPATSMNKGEWVEVSQKFSSYENVYIRIYYEGTTAMRCIDDVTLIYDDNGNSQTTYNVTASANISNGTVTADKDKAAVGETVTLTAHPNAGYKVENWSLTNAYGIDGKFDITTISDNQISFIMKGFDMKYYVSFIEDSPIPSITAESTLNIPYTEGEATFEVTWTGMEDVDVNLYTDEECTSVFDGSWFQAELDGDNNIYYVSEENATNSSRTVYMQLYGLDSESEEYTQVVTVTQAAAPQKYTVTIEEPVNGTLTVMYGETPVKSGDKFYMGEKITATATPADGYKFRYVQFTDASAHTFSTSNEKEWNMGDHDVTISAVFDEIQQYTVAFSVNGTIVESKEYKEGATVSVPENPEAINGKVFTGWIETATLEGETPTYVTPSATATKTVTYYAVFATVTGSGMEEKTHITTNDQVKSAYPSSTNYDTKYNTNDWTGKYAFVYQKTGPYYALTIGYNTDQTKGAYNSHLTSPSLTEGATSIEIQLGSKNTNKPTFYLCDRDEIGCVKDGDQVYGKATVEDPTGSITIPITGAPKQFHIYVDKSVHISSIVVTYGSTKTYSNFTTLPGCYTRSVKSGNYGTICLAQAVGKGDLEGAVAYEVAGVQKEGEKLTGLVISPVESMEAGKPYIFKATAGELVAVLSGDAVSDAVNGNGLVGNLGTSKLPVPGGCYILQSNELKKVKEGATGVTIGANRAYIDLSTASAVTSAEVKGAVVFDIDEATSILGIEIENTGNKIFDMQGRRVNNAQKGIYIINGRKVVH